jgi:hypothetical protein
VILNQATSMFGFDAYAYWSIDLDNLYGASGGNTSDLGAFRYTPAIGQAFALFRLIPWELFLALWFAAMIVSLVWLTGRSWLVLLAFPPVPLELYHGNVHLLMAVAIVLGFRYPAAWAFVLLTKVTPGVGLLWFAVRREWRSLAIALGVTGLLVAVSLVVDFRLWGEWIDKQLQVSLAKPPSQPQIEIPLLLRLPAAALLVIWGARTDRKWTVPASAALAMPVLWIAALSVVVAVLALYRPELQPQPRPAKAERPSPDRLPQPAASRS